LRYEVALSAVTRKDPVGDPLTVSSHDVSTRGVGIVSGEQLHAGDIVEVSFIIPDKGEQITAKGMVVWASAIGPNRYRIGISVSGQEINPISLVLRSIRVRTNRFHD
jgi:uncharacterized Zn finger protein